MEEVVASMEQIDILDDEGDICFLTNFETIPTNPIQKQNFKYITQQLLENENVIDAFLRRKLIGQTMLTLAQNVTYRLNREQYNLRKIIWTNGESNLDTEYSKITCRIAEEEWKKICTEIPFFGNVVMEAKHPDVTCTFRIDSSDDMICLPQKIELKSSMKSSIPGSTSRSLEVDIPIIYCLRPDPKRKVLSDLNSFQFVCGQYIDSMFESTQYDIFQDRSPRPRISVKSLQKVCRQEFTEATFPFDDYILHLAKCSMRRIHILHRKQVKTSWQDNLVENILKLSLHMFSEKISIKITENTEGSDFIEKVKLENIMKEVYSDMANLFFKNVKCGSVKENFDVLY